MNNAITHRINSRELTTYHPIAEELTLNKEKNYLFDLSHLQVIDLQGEKSIDFLQGQLTCDVTRISDIAMVQGAQCNLKGRILNIMDILTWQGVKLILPKDLVDLTINSLIKTAQLSKVTLNSNEQLKLLGLYLQNPKDILPKATYFPNTPLAQTHTATFCYYHLGDGFYVFLIHAVEESNFCKAFIEEDQMLGSLTWHSLRLGQKQVAIYPESRTLFLPHRLDLHQTNMISFDKGCYKGQEIIARTHYRATLKHELRLFTIQTNGRIYSGQKLFNDGLEYGELIDYSIINHNTYLITASVLKEPIQTVFFEGIEHKIAL